MRAPLDKGDPVVYRSISRALYDGVVVAVRPDGRVDIDLQCNPANKNDTFLVTKIETRQGYSDDIRSAWRRLLL